jgi:hypothetical protein
MSLLPRLGSASVVVLSLVLVPFAIGCGSAPAADEGVDDSEADLSTTYGNLLETLGPQDLDRWIAARASIVDGFDRICGDTICSGDYSNLTTVRLACSSTSKALKMKDCAWVLGGNIDYVDGRTGKLTTDARVFTCKIPVASSAKAMLDTLSAAGDDALNAPLPGTGKSFYDALVDCFSGVVGSLPPDSTKTFYGELGEQLWATDEAAGSAWVDTKRKLAQGFDDVCGDSFCEGDYSDISALGFACSLNANSQRVARCSWTFAAADMSVDSRGQIVSRTTTKRCNIEVGAQQADLRAALAGDDPLNAPLPGKTTSIYDALIGCL